MPRPVHSICTSLLLIALFFGTLGLVKAQESMDIPVDEEYKKFFVYFEDQRSVLTKALNVTGYEPEIAGRGFALIAGISQYEKLGQLKPAGIDIAKLIDYFKTQEHFSEIVVLKDKDFNQKNLRYFLQTYFPERIKNSFPKSRFIFAYSGHGMNDGDQGYILEHDADSLSDKKHAVNLSVIRTMIGEVKRYAHHLLVLINSCYGGNFLTASFGEDKTYVPDRSGAHAITAGAGQELVYADPELGPGSMFFETIFAALDERADTWPPRDKNEPTSRGGDGIITYDEFAPFVKLSISRMTTNNVHPLSGDLNPVAKRSLGGFFFLNRARQVTAGIVKPWNTDNILPFGEAQTGANTKLKTQTSFDLESNTSTWNQTYDYSLDQAVQTADGGYAFLGEGTLLKVDAQGLLQWKQAYGTKTDTVISMAVPNVNSGFALVGITKTIVGDSHNFKGFLIRVNNQGRVQWRQNYDADRLAFVIPIADGGFVLAGETFHEDKDHLDGLLIRINDQGKEQWRQTYSSPDDANDWIEGIIKTSDGGFALAGQTTGNGDVWLVKVNAQGRELWNYNYDILSDDNSRGGLVQTTDGGFAIAGQTSIGIGFPTLGLLIKVDARGKKQWSQIYSRGKEDEKLKQYSRTESGKEDETFQGIMTTTDGGFFLTGFTKTELGVLQYKFKGLLIKVDTHGVEQWRRSHGASINAITNTTDGRYILAGDIKANIGAPRRGLALKVDVK